MQEIALKDIHPNENNVRQVKASKEGLNELAASIKSNGLLKNLIVRKNGSGYVIVDGHRRYDALKMHYGEETAVSIPCMVIGDDKTETEIGLQANMMHEEMHPMDQCDAIDKIVSQGEEDYDGVAKKFGRTKKWVSQRVKLSQLSPKAKKEFRNMKFGIGVAEALTLGTHKEQDQFLKDNEGRGFEAHNVEYYMLHGKVDVTKALYKWEDHRKELGIQEDLFSENVFITNLDAHNRLNREFLENKVKEEREKGYKDVILLWNETPFDNNPAIKNLTVCLDKRKSIKNLYLVISFIPYNANLREELMEEKQTETKPSTVDSEGNSVEEDEKTPLTFSNPQKEELDQYFGYYMRNLFWDNMSKFDHNKFTKALAVHRCFGYDYSYDRMGMIHAENKDNFHRRCEVTEDDYPSEYNSFICEIQDQFIEANQSNGIDPFKYCYNLDDDTLDKLFFALCIRSFSQHDFYSKEFRSFVSYGKKGSPFQDNKEWFSPSKKWLNKYKSEQLTMLYTNLGGERHNAARGEMIDYIHNHLKENGGFDPFQKEWT